MDRYVSYATKPSSPVNTWNRDDDDDPRGGGGRPTGGTPPRGGGNDGNDSGSGRDWDRGGDRDDHDGRDNDHNANCRRFSNGKWRCEGHNGHSDGHDRDDALRKYLRLRPIIYPIPRPIIYPGRPVILGGREQDIDIDVKNVYNIEAPDEPETMPTSGGRNVPAPVDQAPSVEGGFSLQGLPSWGLPVIVLGGVLVLVMLMKK